MQGNNLFTYFLKSHFEENCQTNDASFLPEEIKDNVCLIFTKNWTHIKATHQIMPMFVIIWPSYLIFAKENLQKFLPNTIEIYDALKGKPVFLLLLQTICSYKRPLLFKHILVKRIRVFLQFY